MSDIRKYDTFCAYRPIEPSYVTQQLLTEIHGFVDAVIEPIGAALIEDKTVDDVITDNPDTKRTFKGVPIQAAPVYNEEQLRISLFSRRAPVEMNFRPMFSEACDESSREFVSSKPRRYHDEHDMVENDDFTPWENPLHRDLRRVGLELGIADPDSVTVVFIGLQRIIDTDHSNMVFALTPMYPSRGAELINRESEILLDHYKDLAGGNDLAYPLASSVLNMPILELPRNTPYKKVEWLVNRVQSEGLRKPLSAQFLPVMWDTNTTAIT